MSVTFLTDQDKVLIDASIKQNSDTIATLTEEMEDNACVNYLPPYPDAGETTKNGITYHCNDNVFTFSGTSSATTIVWLYDLENELPAWWIPGKTVRVMFNKGVSYRRVYFRIYGYAADGSVTLLLDLTDGGVYEYTIPDRADLKGIQVRYHIPSGALTDTTATIRILSTTTNAELAQIVGDARTALPVTMVDGLYIRGESGAERANASLLASEPIDVSSYRGMPISVRSYLNGVIGFAFYSALPCNADTYISGVSGNTSGMAEIDSEVTVTVPDNAAYLRISGYTGYDQNCRIVPNVTLAQVSEQAQQGGKRVFQRNIAMFGDSITWGRDGNGASTDRTENTIPETVAKMLGVSVANYGVSGMGWLPTSTCPDPIYTKLTTVDLTMYDTVTICLGVNDGFSPLGEWNSEDETTVMGQVNKCIKHIYAQNPSVRLVLIAPFNGRNVGSFPDYWYTDSDSTSYTSRNRLSDALEKVCDYYWIPYIDQHDGPVNAYTIQTLIGEDGVHPSEEGYKRIGEWIAGELRRLIG